LHFIPYFFVPFPNTGSFIAVAVVVRQVFAHLAAAASRLVAVMLGVGGHGRKAQAFNLEDTPTNYNKYI
jgi:hypothetical protein